MSLVRFIETSIFTKRIVEILEDEEYRHLQEALAFRPDLGDVLPGSGGLRKVRWKTSRKGKRSGVRVIYYWAIKEATILMHFIFKKNERSDLTAVQIEALRRIVEEE